jgi:hypothetical protein
MEALQKRIGQFDPARDDRAAAERHYEEVHTLFARRMFRDEAPRVARYATNLALRQYDVGGGFRQQPAAWRWVVTKVAARLLEGEGGRDSTGWLPLDYQQLIWRDHLSCVKNLRSCEVLEEVLATHPAAVPSSVKYLFVVEQGEGVDASSAAAHYRDVHLPALRSLLGRAFGLRLAMTNAVEHQLAVAPLAEEGQVFTGGYDASTSRVAIEEWYFDNWTWGDEFFALPEVQALYLRSPTVLIEGYGVEEVVGLDRT